MKKKEDMEVESSCTKTQLLIDTLAEKNLTVASKETEFEFQDESDQYYFSTFSPTDFPLRKNTESGNQVIFQEWKSVDWYLKGRNAACSYGEQKVWSPGKNRIILHFLTFSLRKISDQRNIYQKNVIERCFIFCKVFEEDIDVKNSPSCFESIDSDY